MILLCGCVQSDNISNDNNIVAGESSIETVEKDEQKTIGKRYLVKIEVYEYPKSKPAKQTVESLEKHILGNGAKSLERLENDICIVQHIELKEDSVINTVVYIILKSAELYQISGFPGNIIETNSSGSSIKQGCSYGDIHLDDEYLYFNAKAELWDGIEIECKFDLESRILYYDKEKYIEAYKIWNKYINNYNTTIRPQKVTEAIDIWYDQELQKATGEIKLPTHSFYNTRPKPQTVEEMEDYVLKEPFGSLKRLENDICIVQYVCSAGVPGTWYALYELLGSLQSLQNRVDPDRFIAANLILDDEYLYFNAMGKGNESKIRIECKFELENQVLYYNQEQYEAALKIWYEQELRMALAHPVFVDIYS